MKKIAIKFLIMVLIVCMFPVDIYDSNTGKGEVKAKPEDLLRVYDNNGNRISEEKVNAEYEGYIVSKLDGSIEVVESIDEINTANVNYIEPNYVGRILEEYSPNDPLYNDNKWAYDLMNIQSVWNKNYFGKYDESGDAPIVAVIDTGLYGTGYSTFSGHEDLNYSNIVPGRNTVKDNINTNDDHWHGTFVSGIIAASIHNNKGIAGDMSDVRICPIKCVNSLGSYTVANEIEAIQEAVRKGADVINLSIGYPTYTDAEKEAIQDAAEKGVIICAAAGNNGSTLKYYPSAQPNVISVSSIDSTGNLADYSNYGDEIDVTAPGSDIVGINLGVGYRRSSGTSFSCPQVSALAAMCKDLDPTIDHDRFMQLLKETCVDIGEPGRDDYYGWGRIDFGAAYEKLAENPNSLMHAKIEGLEDKSYTGTEIEQEDLVVKMPSGDSEKILTEGEDYVLEYSDNTYIGKAKILINPAQGSEYTGAKRAEFAISGTFEDAGISSNSVGLEKHYYYTGSEIIPTVTIIDSQGKELVQGIDYSMNCTSNINVGTGIIDITGIGLYSGTIRVEFIIEELVRNGEKNTNVSSDSDVADEEKTTDESKDVIKVLKPTIKSIKAGKKSFTVTWKKKSVDGYQLQYSTSKAFKKSSRKTITISKNKTSYTIKKLKAKKKYYVRMRAYKIVGGKKKCGKWSDVKKLKTK